MKGVVIPRSARAASSLAGDKWRALSPEPQAELTVLCIGRKRK
jgi:hypothetical protein